MVTPNTETSHGEDASSEPKSNRFAATIEKRGRDGSAATVAGGGALAWSLATIRTSKRRAALLALTSLGLLGAGLRQQRTERSGDGGSEAGGSGKKVSAEARVQASQDLGAQRNADESAGVYQSEAEPNPRGVSDRSDLETDDGGDIRFVEGEQPESHRETHLEDEDAHDTRIHPESDDERTQVDLSTASMADEASEAAGPHPEQSYPAFEGTDPEPTSEEAPERVGEGAVAPGGTDADEGQAGDDIDGDDGAPEEQSD